MYKYSEEKLGKGYSLCRAITAIQQQDEPDSVMNDEQEQEFTNKEEEHSLRDWFFATQKETMKDIILGGKNV
jgi:hypothetical protein